MTCPKQPLIAYYDVKSNQNLTAEEWKQLYLTNSDKITLINKSGSNLTIEKEEYGPCTNSYCPCSSYELRKQLKQKQEDFDNLWDKFNEYDSKWEDYKKVVDSNFSNLDLIRRNPASKIMDNPITKLVTEFTPGAGLLTWKYDMSIKELEDEAENNLKNGCKNCYTIISEKYSQIVSWYRGRKSY
ncbi:MAG: hypothetical protein LBR43_03125 [Spiroplasmataceae bacterium]|jgi:hypothetical protein|nr:hypothetical protein [Spiroplasmataceae bacterium]